MRLLSPFLVKLKDHLESVQVCLGEVDSWLMDVKSNTEFLESTFGVSLETPGDADAYVSNNGEPFVTGTTGALQMRHVCVVIILSIGTNLSLSTATTINDALAHLLPVLEGPAQANLKKKVKKKQKTFHVYMNNLLIRY